VTFHVLNQRNPGGQKLRQNSTKHPRNQEGGGSAGMRPHVIARVQDPDSRDPPQRRIPCPIFRAMSTTSTSSSPIAKSSEYVAEYAFTIAQKLLRSRFSSMQVDLIPILASIRISISFCRFYNRCSSSSPRVLHFAYSVAFSERGYPIAHKESRKSKQQPQHHNPKNGRSC